MSIPKEGPGSHAFDLAELRFVDARLTEATALLHGAYEGSDIRLNPAWTARFISFLSRAPAQPAAPTPIAETLAAADREISLRKLPLGEKALFFKEGFLCGTRLASKPAAPVSVECGDRDCTGHPSYTAPADPLHQAYTGSPEQECLLAHLENNPDPLGLLPAAPTPRRDPYAPHHADTEEPDAPEPSAYTKLTPLVQATRRAESAEAQLAAVRRIVTDAEGSVMGDSMAKVRGRQLRAYSRIRSLLTAPSPGAGEKT